MKYKDFDILINYYREDSEKHIEEDYKVLMENGVDNIVKEQFIPWILGEELKDKNPEKVFEGLKLFEVSYCYGKITEKYSPTGKEEYFGEFKFCYERGNDYVKDIFQAVAMQVYICDNKIVKVSFHDI